MTRDLRTHVLEASVELIAEVGLGQLSMREVARRAGVSHQAPYHYFADKESIVAALVEQGFTRLATRLEAAEATGDSAPQRLVRAGHAYVEFALAEPVYFRIMFRPELVDLTHFPSAAQAGARALAVLHRLVAAVLGSRASPARRDAMVSMHWSLAHGLASLLLDGALATKFVDEKERARHVDQVLGLFAAAISAQDLSRSSA